jgi:hypothetical protein
VDAAASVAALGQDEAAELTEELARHSLIYLDSSGDGPRARMLDTIRVFAAEQLDARDDAEEIRRRHARYYRALAEAGGTLLRRDGWSEWAERFDVERGNVVDAVRWYLRHDRTPLPHLFRQLLPLWAVKSNDLSEVRSWVEQLLPSADSLDIDSRAELLSAAAVTSREVGDDQAATAARQRLTPLVDLTHDQYLRAVCALVTSWTTAILGDLDTAIGLASLSLGLLREQDEPLWTTATLISLGSIESPIARYDDAWRHLSEARDLAQRYGNPRLINSSAVQLGVLAVRRGNAAEARTLLGESVALSVSNHSIRNLTMTLSAYASLAVDDGEPEHAAVLAGAADGIRERAGLRWWPMFPQLVDRIGDALGASRRDELLAAGRKLSLREAAEAATERDRPPGG